MKDVIKMDEASRRNFMKTSALAMLGVSMSQIPFTSSLLGAPNVTASVTASQVAGSPSAKRVIYLYMNGGMSHIDTFDPKPENKEVAGKSSAIKTSATGLRVSNYLPLTAKQMHNVCVLNSVSSTVGAHEPADYFMHTSYAARSTIVHPGMGAWMMQRSGKVNTALPGNVLVSGSSRHPGAGFLETMHAPLPIGNPSSGLKNSRRHKSVEEARFQKRLDMAKKMNEKYLKKHDKKQVRAYHKLYQETVDLMRSEDLAVFDINKESKETLELYGESNFAKGCLLARRLVEHDVSFIEVQLGGWDTHVDNFTTMEGRGAELDQGLSALLYDLDRRGMLKETLVVLASEFGRSPAINGAKGRDHHPKAFSCLLAGGGVQGGQVYGKTDDKGFSVTEKKVLVPDFNATIAYALGMDLKEQTISPSKRPFTVADKGNPVTTIF